MDGTNNVVELSSWKPRSTTKKEGTIMDPETGIDAVFEHEVHIQYILGKLGLKLSKKATDILWGSTFAGVA